MKVRSPAFRRKFVSGLTEDTDSMKDFFISYNKADRRWAEWIAWQLEEAGYTVIVQAWDFRPGSNFVLDMQRAAVEATRTIAVLSPEYLVALFTQPEWAAAFAQDPTGEKGLLLPVRVRECEIKGLLHPIVYIDLFKLEEAAAKLPSNRSVHPSTRDALGIVISLSLRSESLWSQGRLMCSLRQE